MLRVPTKLDEATESLAHRVIGCCMNVHRELGPGLVEQIYQRAVELELRVAAIQFEREKRFKVIYREKCLYIHRLDLVVEERLMIELKAVERLHPVHTAQALSCLRISKLKLCLLINFNAAILKDGIKRVVL
jgi:GxxExxY protein